MKAFFNGGTVTGVTVALFNETYPAQQWLKAYDSFLERGTVKRGGGGWGVTAPLFNETCPAQQWIKAYDSLLQWGTVTAN